MLTKNKKMIETNKRLRELYEANFMGINEVFDSKINIDGPHLMFCWDEAYHEVNKKILFIGQEGTGNVFRDYLGGERLDHEVLQKTFLNSCTDNYKVIVHKQIKKPRGEFWRQVNRINKAINKETELPSFMTTNVSKYCNCKSYGKPPLRWTDHKFSVEKFNILSKEIEIAKPDIVIFFSGPNYDDKIKCQFIGELNFKPLDPEIPTRILARIEHPILPFHAYRTYHPNSRIKRKLEYIDIILKNILKD